MNCEICYENPNDTTIKLINCPKCSKMTCLTCGKRYLLSIIEEPHCIHCRHYWSREFISMNFPKVFVNVQLKNSREDILKNQEMSLLPETQTIMERIREIDTETNKLKEKVKQDEEHMSRLMFDIIDKYTTEVRKLNKMKETSVDEVRRKYMKCIDEMNTKIYNNIDFTNNILKKKDIQLKSDFIYSCSNSECRGFLTKKYACGICNTKTCSKCLSVEGDNHECNEDNIKTATEIKNNTKSCPSCGIRISKISGCNQMWCTYCNTGFDWVTLKKITKGVIHNPHYFQYLKENKVDRIAFGEDCNLLPPYNLIINRLSGRHEITYISSIYRHTLHIYDITMNKYVVDDEDIQSKKFYLRVKYLNKKIDEIEWKRRLQQIEKDTAKKTEIFMVLDMLYRTTNDILTQLTIIEMKDYHLIITQFDKIQEYFNEQMMLIKKNYNCVVPLLSDNWEVHVS